MSEDPRRIAACRWFAGSYDPVDLWTLGSRPQVSEYGLRHAGEVAVLPETRRIGLRRPIVPRTSAEDRTRGRGGASSRGGNAQESTDSAAPPWPGQGVETSTDSRGEQSFEAGVPAEMRRARRHGNGRRKDVPQRARHPSALTVARIRRHGSCVRRTPSGSGRAKSSTRRLKAIAKLPCRRADGGRTRTRKEAKARESGHGSPGRESSAGRLQGARAA